MRQLIKNYICEKQVSITKEYIYLENKSKVRCSKYQLVQAS